jgi:hypothetical protein
MDMTVVRASENLAHMLKPRKLTCVVFYGAVRIYPNPFLEQWPSG